MIRKHHIQLLKFLSVASLFSTMLIFLVSYHGIKDGIHSLMLFWSLYVVCIPGAHGKILIGFPCGKFFNIVPSTEPYIWSFMVVLNILSFIFRPEIYQTILPTQLLYLIITTPYPCWVTFATAFPGTFYRSLIGVHSYKARHAIIRLLLIIGGIIAFLFFTHKELITLLHTVAHHIG